MVAQSKLQKQQLLSHWVGIVYLGHIEVHQACWFILLKDKQPPTATKLAMLSFMEIQYVQIRNLARQIEQCFHDDREFPWQTGFLETVAGEHS